jgi:hypothetical protein
MDVIYTNKHRIPEILYQILISDDYDGPRMDIGVNKLVDSPRIRVLHKRHRDRIKIDVSEIVRMKLIGVAIHEYISQRIQDSNLALSEVPIVQEIRGWKVGGIIDVIKDDGTLVDIKTTLLGPNTWVTGYRVKREWELQLNSYAYLANRVGRTVNDLEVWGIILDWTELKSARDCNVPDSSVFVRRIKRLDLNYVGQFLEHRVKLHQEAEELSDTQLPLCTEEERWTRPTKYKVMRGKNKRATRVFDDMESAKALADSKGSDYYVKVVPGEDMRCSSSSYCKVREFCDYYRKHVRKE